MLAGSAKPMPPMARARLVENPPKLPAAIAMDFQIDHVPRASRFEVIVDGLRCVVDYRLADGVIAITHTGVPPPLEGRGIAGRLVQALLDHARAEGLKVVPLCSYASGYMRRHPETQALLA